MISAYLAKSVKEKNIKGIRGALKGIIDADPAFKSEDGVGCEFDEAVRYILDSGISEQELFDAHDGQFGQEECEELWTREYYFRALNYLSYNFSRERIKHLKRVGRAMMADDQVYREKAAGNLLGNEKKKELPARQERDTNRMQNGSTEDGNKIWALFLIVAIILLAIVLVRLL